MEIKYYIKILNHSLINFLHLSDVNVDDIMTVIHHQLSSIYLGAYDLSFAIDLLFNPMRSSITEMFGEELLHLENDAVSH